MFAGSPRAGPLERITRQRRPSELVRPAGGAPGSNVHVDGPPVRLANPGETGLLGLVDGGVPGRDVGCTSVDVLGAARTPDSCVGGRRAVPAQNAKWYVAANGAQTFEVVHQMSHPTSDGLREIARRTVAKLV